MHLMLHLSNSERTVFLPQSTQGCNPVVNHYWHILERYCIFSRLFKLFFFLIKLRSFFLVALMQHYLPVFPSTSSTENL